MKRDTLYYASALPLLAFSGLLLEPSAAFVSSSTRGQQLVKLNLVPGQGNQLVAAYNAATCKKTELEDDENDTDAVPQAAVTITVNDPVGVAQDTPRNFVKRAFSLPSHKKHPHPKAEGLESTSSDSPSFPMETSKDVVYFPLVGFTFCRSGDRVIPLPTQSNVSCRLRTNRKEELYGWFSPVCKLDLYAEDPCRAPVKAADVEQ